MNATVAMRFTQRWEFDLAEPVRSAVLSPDGAMVAIAAVEGPIAVLRVDDGGLVARFAGHTMGTKAIDWSRDSSCVVSCGQDGAARVWDLNGSVRAMVDLGSQWGECVAASPRHDTFATAAGRVVRLWSLDGALLRDWPARSSTVLDIAWRPGSLRTRLAALSYGAVALYDPAKGDRAARELRWKGSSLVVAWSPDGARLATGDQDASVHFWLVREGRDLMMSGYPRKVRELAWDRTGRWLATGGGTQAIVWDCLRSPEGTDPVVLEHHERPLCKLAYQRRGNLLASASIDGALAVWDPAREREPLASLPPDDDEITALVWTANDDVIVSRQSGSITQWTAALG